MAEQGCRVVGEVSRSQPPGFNRLANLCLSSTAVRRDVLKADRSSAKFRTNRFPRRVTNVFGIDSFFGRTGRGAVVSVDGLDSDVYRSGGERLQKSFVDQDLGLPELRGAWSRRSLWLIWKPTVIFDPSSRPKKTTDVRIFINFFYPQRQPNVL